MVRLICRGSKTKMTTEWIPGGGAIQRLTALGNGADFGEFPTAAEAKAHAEVLLAKDRSATFLVWHEDGRVTDWVYDLREQHRIDYRRGWINAFYTAPILALITAGTIALYGIPILSMHGLLFIAGSVGIYLFMRLSQNEIEGLVVWFIMFILGVVAIPVFIQVQDREQAVKCLNQAWQIAIACHQYAADHEGGYPRNLDQLIPDYLPDKQIFDCPIRRDQAPLGYDYFGGKESDPPRNVLLSSKATTRTHKRIVVTSDGAAVLERDE